MSGKIGTGIMLVVQLPDGKVQARMKRPEEDAQEWLCKAQADDRFARVAIAAAFQVCEVGAGGGE